MKISQISLKFQNLYLYLYITKNWNITFNVTTLLLSYISRHVITLLFSKIFHNFKILFLNISHNFIILLKRNDFQPYLDHKDQSYVNTVNVVFNANPSVSPLLLLLLFSSFMLSKLQNFTFLTPNSLSSLLGLFISSESLLRTYSIATLLKKSLLHTCSSPRYALSLPFVINILLFFQLIEH